MDDFVYRYGNALYINLTNRCPNSCYFCVRNFTDQLGDASCLWLGKEPNSTEVEQLCRGKVADCKEIVFCGYGEPTCRMDVLTKVAASLRDLGLPLRLNTNGLGSLINNRNIVHELADVLDSVSVSLNAENSVIYQKICQSVYGESAFNSVLDFIRDCKKTSLDVATSVVDIPEIDKDACKKLAVSLGVSLRIRSYGQ